MKFVQVDKDGIINKSRKRLNLFALLTEFQKSDMEFVELMFENDEYKNASICAATWDAAIKRYGFRSLRAFYRGNHAYLEKIKQ